MQPASQPHILVAGIGNIFMADDAFGVAVAQQLARRALPAHVRVVDYGIRGIDLAYALLDQPDLTIMVDATMRGEAPGTLYLIEPDQDALGAAEQAIDPHGLNPISVLHMVRSLGGQPGRLMVVGCEPALLEAEDGRIGLSAPVQAAVDGAIDMIMSLIEQSCGKPAAERKHHETVADHPASRAGSGAGNDRDELEGYSALPLDAVDVSRRA